MKRLYLMMAGVIMLGTAKLPAQMVKPEFGPEREKLSFLVGQFNTKTEITMGDNSSSSSGYVKAHWGLDSMFVLIASSEANPMMGEYKGFGVLGYDSRNGEYELSMFNNFAELTQYKGNFVGDTLILKSQIDTPQGPIDQELKWYKSGESVRLEVLNDLGQGYILTVDQTATPVTGKDRSEE